MLKPTYNCSCILDVKSPWMQTLASLNINEGYSLEYMGWQCHVAHLETHFYSGHQKYHMLFAAYLQHILIERVNACSNAGVLAQPLSAVSMQCVAQQTSHRVLHTCVRQDTISPPKPGCPADTV